MRKLILILTLVSATAFSQERWIQAYVMNWSYTSDLAQEMADDSVYNGFIWFAMGLNSNGTYFWDQAIANDSLHALNTIQIGHAAGMTHCVVQIFPHLAEMNAAWSSDGARRSSVSWLMGMVRQMNLDGIAWDMETGYPTTWGAFNAILRDSLDAVGTYMGKPLTNQVWTYGNTPNDTQWSHGEWQYFDRIEIEAYEQTGAYQGWIVWNGYGVYSRGVTLPCYPYIPATGIDSSWTAWKRIGVPDSMLMVSQAGTGRIWQGGLMVANVLGTSVTGTDGALHQGDVWTGSYPPNCSNPYSGMPQVSGFEVEYRDIVSTYAASPTEHDTLAISSHKSVDNVGNDNDKFITFADPWVFWQQYQYMWKVRNGGGFSVWAPLGGRLGAGNFPLQDALRMARDDEALPPAPTGTFSADPDTFAAGGGTTTLTWTSSNADIVTISPAIGVVAANGDTTVNLSSTITFTLTVSNATAQVPYYAHVGVAASEAQGGFSVVDSFNRATNSTVGSGWLAPSGTTIMSVGNAYYTPQGQICIPYNCGFAHCQSGRGFAYREETFGDDQYAEITPFSLLAGYRYCYAGVRMGGANGEGYYAKTDGAATWVVVRNSAGTETIVQTLSVPFTEYGSDRLKIQVVGSAIKVYKNGLQINLDYTDTTITHGSPGMSTTPDNNAALDNFIGGDFGEVAPQPYITVTASLTPFVSTIPDPSPEQSYTVSGVRLTGDLTITAPLYFEISLSSGSGWENPIALTPAGDSTVATTTIYIRSHRTSIGGLAPAAYPWQSYVQHSSPGATTQSLAVYGEASLAGTILDKRLLIRR